MKEIKIKNKEGVVVINRILSGKCVPIKENNILSNRGKSLLFEDTFLSSLVYDKKVEEKSD